MSEKYEAFLLSDGAEVRLNNVAVADVFAGKGWASSGGYHITVEECHARAKLFAAAPDMLKELALAHTALVGAAYPEYVSTEDDAKHRLSEIDAVIERATGKKPLETYCDAIMAEGAAPDLERERDALLEACREFISHSNSPYGIAEDYHTALEKLKTAYREIVKARFES